MSNKTSSSYRKSKYLNDLILNTPQLNQGTAFTKQERKQLNLLGKLPYSIETLDKQVKRAYQQFISQPDLKQKNLFLSELYNTNQILFYKLVSNHLEEMVPIIYTPQVASTCSSFSDEFRQPTGAYIAYPNRKNINKILDNIIRDEIDIIVVTDGERILGIGDQGVGSIGISVGKLMLYTLFGGINPKRTLPIILDVGTNNKKLLNNPYYLGWRNTRIKGNNYLNFIKLFVSGVKKRLPHVLLQWEDFGKNNAWKLLDLYRDKICSFNDDIQGTAAVTLAAILAATKVSKQKLSNQRIVIFGAGSAAIGIVKILQSYIKHKENKIFNNIWLLDCEGLITCQLKNITDIQRPYLRKIDEIRNWQVKDHKNITLLEVIKNVKPTVLLGYSTAPCAFTEKIVKEMTKHVERPIIFPLSNPTANCEATPSDLIKWTNGKVLIATGSPFPPVTYKNKKIVIAQCNNALVFPGIGLGIVASKARKIPDEIFWNAAEVLYKKSPAFKNNKLPLLPSVNEIPTISKAIGKRVAGIAIKQSLSPVDKKANIRMRINQNIWQPKYEN